MGFYMIISKIKYVGFELRSYVNQIYRIQTMDHVLVEPPAACKNGQSRTYILNLCHESFTGSQISNLLNLNEKDLIGCNWMQYTKISTH